MQEIAVIGSGHTDVEIVKYDYTSGCSFRNVKAINHPA